MENYEIFNHSLKNTHIVENVNSDYQLSYFTNTYIVENVNSDYQLLVTNETKKGTMPNFLSRG